MRRLFMYIRATLGRELNRPGARRPLPGGFYFFLHICYANSPLATREWAAYLRLVRFYSSSQKPDPKRGTPPPNRAFQIGPLRSSSQSRSGLFYFMQLRCLLLATVTFCYFTIR